MNLRLIEPSKELEGPYYEYVMEWLNSGEMIVPSASGRYANNYDELLQFWEYSKTVAVYEKGFVPATLYFMVDDCSRIIGALDFRHVLNDDLLNNGGHLGSGIRPSERGKGYGSHMLRLGLKAIKEKGLSKVLITCDHDNISSAKTIEKNAGILENVLDINGELIKRYWVKLL